MILLELLAASAEDAPSNIGYIALFGAAATWSALWMQFIVLPFFNKGEAIHKDYWQGGEINAAKAAIETTRLLPALAQMFQLAIDARSDKRKKPDGDIEELLQSVEFRPFLERAQAAMSAIDQITDLYHQLRQSSTRLWRWGLGHALLTPALPFIYIFAMPIDYRMKWLLILVAGVWLVTLFMCIKGAVAIHSKMGCFSTALEVEES